MDPGNITHSFFGSALPPIGTVIDDTWIVQVSGAISRSRSSPSLCLLTDPPTTSIDCSPSTDLSTEPMPPPRWGMCQDNAVNVNLLILSVLTFIFVFNACVFICFSSRPFGLSRAPLSLVLTPISPTRFASARPAPASLWTIGRISSRPRSARKACPCPKATSR